MESQHTVSRSANPAKVQPSQPTASRTTMPSSKKIWIDLDNSPHVPFFLPIIEGLEKQGYRVILTARDSYQVCELLRLHSLSCRVVGRHYGKNRILKLLGTGLRTMQLLPFILAERPDLAVSHTSRAQILTSYLLRIPSVAMTDYEFATATGFVHPNWAFVPDMIPSERLSQKSDRLLRYPGLKEDVYVPRFRPDPGLRNQLGIAQDEVLVILRPPATEAHYHNPESELLFDESLKFLLKQSGTRVVLLPRNQTQTNFLRSQWAEAIQQKHIIIPAKAVDGLNLIWNADLVISGGGTMNREAAALGVPVYSIFRGKIGGVDQCLAKTGRLTLIENVQDIPAKIELKPRVSDLQQEGHESRALSCIVEAIISIAENGCLPPRQ